MPFVFPGGAGRRRQPKKKSGYVHQTHHPAPCGCDQRGHRQRGPGCFDCRKSPCRFGLYGPAFRQIPRGAGGRAFRRDLPQHRRPGKPGRAAGSFPQPASLFPRDGGRIPFGECTPQAADGKSLSGGGPGQPKTSRPQTGGGFGGRPAPGSGRWGDRRAHWRELGAYRRVPAVHVGVTHPLWAGQKPY